MQAYGPLLEIAPQLWHRTGEWQESTLKRRMTVIRLTSTGELLIINPFELKPTDLKELETLGPVRFIIAPNSLHGDQAPWFYKKFPEAELFAPTPLLARWRKEGIDVQPLASLTNELLHGEVTPIELHGTRMHEWCFIHHQTETLITTDIVFNMKGKFTGIERILMSWNRIHNHIGPSRFLKWFFINNRELFYTSLQEVFRHPFERIIMNHGDILEPGSKHELRQEFEQYLFKGRPLA